MRLHTWNKRIAAGLAVGMVLLGGCANADFKADTSPISRAEAVTPAPEITPAPTAAPAKINPLEDQFAPTESTEQMAEDGVKGITNSGVNVRSAPKGETVDALPNHAEVEVLGRDGGWFLVKYGEIEGYIYGQFLDIDGVNGLDLED